MTFRERVYILVDEDTKVGNLFGTLIILLIVLNMAAIILESIKSLETQYKYIFDGFENFCLVFFTIEYVARMMTADIKTGEKGWRPFVKYFFSFMALVDLFAILPSILLLILPKGMLANLQFIRMLRIMRIFRVLKISRYSSSLKMMGEVLKDKRSDLSITIFVTLVLMILASTLMYYAEHSAQPDQFPDIVHAFWWAIATLTTVGYGDVYPVTALGKILSGVIALLGIGLVALPTGILSSAFVDKMDLEKERKRANGEPLFEEEEGAEGGANGIPGPEAAAAVARTGPGPQARTIVLPNGDPLDCPHDTLLKSGDFPAWMQFCPLCGTDMKAEPAQG